MTLPQGELGLLETETAQQLLVSAVIARVAYTGLDGKPRLPVRRAARARHRDGHRCRRYLGAEGAEAFVSQFDGRPIRMHRIGVRPSWGRTLDVLGGIQGGAH